MAGYGIHRQGVDVYLQAGAMIKLAIVGTGGMAEYQAGKFAEGGRCSLVACADRKLDHAEAFALRFGIPFHCDSIIKLLDRGGFDAATCSVSDSQHHRICSAVLGRRLPVFCEKPLARSLAECRSLASLATEAEVPAMVNFSKRNAPALHALKAVLDAGELGVVESVEASYLQSWVVTSCWGDWRTSPRWKWRLLPGESTAGVAGDLGSHLVDALLFLFGDIEAGRPGACFGLRGAMERGLLAPEGLPPEFSEGGEPGPLAEFSASTSLPDRVPVSIRASWVEKDARDDFVVEVRGSLAEARLDLTKSRRWIELFPRGRGSAARRDASAALRREGPAVVSTYERFTAAVEARLGLKSAAAAGAAEEAAGAAPQVGAAYKDGSETAAGADLSFEHGLKVMRILDSLIPGGLPP